MSQRIASTELEFGAGLHDMDYAVNQIIHDLSYATELRPGYDFIRSGVPPELRGIDTFLKNGSRFYRDYGNHPEYAVSECDDLDDLVANELAAEGIVYETMSNSVRKLGLPGFELNRRVADGSGQTWGFHENYECERQNYDLGMFILAANHVATRSIYAGAGGYDSQLGIILAQKTARVSAGISGDTTVKKPLVNTRDEPHADAGRFARLHVVGGDALMSPWATRMKVGTMVLLLDAYEARDAYADRLKKICMSENELVRAARITARDFSMQRVVCGAGSKARRALDIQRSFLGVVSDLASDGHMSAQKLDILQHWG